MADHILKPDSRGAFVRVTLLLGVLFLTAAEAPRLWLTYTKAGDVAAAPRELEIGLLAVAIFFLGAGLMRFAGERAVVTRDGLSLRKGSSRFEVPWSNVREIGNVVVPRGNEDWMSWKECELRVRLHEKIKEGEGPTSWKWSTIWVENGEYVVFPQSRYSVLDLARAYRAMSKAAPQGISIRDRLRWRDRKDEEVVKDAAEW
jgi:hypothetical protein